jgi:hypothetical protein
MIHDPMCRNAKRIDPHYDTQGRCDCDLIARVRADEREGERIIYGYNNGYEQGVKDERERAAERVKALLSFPALPYGRHRIDKAAAIAAARGVTL